MLTGVEYAHAVITVLLLHVLLQVFASTYYHHKSLGLLAILRASAHAVITVLMRVLFMVASASTPVLIITKAYAMQ